MLALQGRLAFLILMRNRSNVSSQIKTSHIKPANLQVELHAQFQQKSLRDCCEKHGITICAYAPLGSPGRNNYYIKNGSQLVSSMFLLHFVHYQIIKYWCDCRIIMTRLGCAQRYQIYLNTRS